MPLLNECIDCSYVSKYGGSYLACRHFGEGYVTLALFKFFSPGSQHVVETNFPRLGADHIADRGRDSWFQGPLPEEKALQEFAAAEVALLNGGDA